MLFIDGRGKPPSPARTSARSVIRQVTDTESAESADGPMKRELNTPSGTSPTRWSSPRFLKDLTITYAIFATRGQTRFPTRLSTTYKTWRRFRPHINLCGFHKRLADDAVDEMATHIGQKVK